MKRILFLTILLPFLIINVLGQSQKREELTDTIITLVKEIEDTKIVILLENEDFIVKVSLSNFENDINNWLKEYPFLEDEKLLNIVLKRAKNTNIVNASKVITDGYLVSRLEYRIASLLENGQCLILSKKNNEIVSEIKRQTYSFYCGLLCGGGGRRFYINEILFFQVLDWIS